jgi:hypothetical protein
VHEVHVDAEQLAFFRQALAEAAGRPVVVFTHAPILGSGLKVVQTVHVKNRWGQQNRWLGRVGPGGACGSACLFSRAVHVDKMWGCIAVQAVVVVCANGAAATLALQHCLEASRII